MNGDEKDIWLLEGWAYVPGSKREHYWLSGWGQCLCGEWWRDFEQELKAAPEGKACKRCSAIAARKEGV